MAKNLFTLTVKTTTPADSELLVGGTSSANAYNFTWTKLREWVGDVAAFVFTGSIKANSGAIGGADVETNALLIVGDNTNHGNIYFSSSTPNTMGTGYDFASDTGTFWINYNGYQDNTAWYRKFNVGDGKQGIIATFDGSDKSVVFNGEINSSAMPTASGGLSSGTLWANSNVINIIP